VEHVGEILEPQREVPVGDLDRGPGTPSWEAAPLPAGGRETARELARLPVIRSATMQDITVPTVVVPGGETDTVIARRIAAAIHGRVNAEARQGGSDTDLSHPGTAHRIRALAAAAGAAV